MPVPWRFCLLFLVVLEVEPWALHMIGKCIPSELPSPALLTFLKVLWFQSWFIKRSRVTTLYFLQKQHFHCSELELANFNIAVYLFLRQGLVCDWLWTYCVAKDNIEFLISCFCLPNVGSVSMNHIATVEKGSGVCRPFRVKSRKVILTILCKTHAYLWLAVWLWRSFIQP